MLKGDPTDEELAALIAVLGSAGGGGHPAHRPNTTAGGCPSTSCVTAIFNWQKITLQRT